MFYHRLHLPEFSCSSETLNVVNQFFDQVKADYENALTALRGERDSYKDAVDKAHAELDKSNAILKRADSHRSLPERVEALREKHEERQATAKLFAELVQKCHALISSSPGFSAPVQASRLDVRVATLLKQLENQACTIRDQCTPVSEREQRALHELIELREANARLATDICDARKDRDSAQLQCFELNHNLQRLRACIGLGLGDVHAVYQKLEAHGFKPADANWVTEVSSALDALSNWKVAGKNLKERAEKAEADLQKVREANGVLVEAQKTCDPVLQRTQAEIIERQAGDIAYLRRSNAAMLSALSRFM